MRLHEIELNVRDPEASKRFYRDVLGLPIPIDQKGLKVFQTGLPGVDLNASIHYPAKVSISFLVADLDQVLEAIREKGVKTEEPRDIHLGMRAVSLEDPDGYRIEIQCPTASSPQWLRALSVGSETGQEPDALPG